DKRKRLDEIGHGLLPQMNFVRAFAVTIPSVSSLPDRKLRSRAIRIRHDAVWLPNTIHNGRLVNYIAVPVDQDRWAEHRRKLWPAAHRTQHIYRRFAHLMMDLKFESLGQH